MMRKRRYLAPPKSVGKERPKLKRVINNMNRGIIIACVFSAFICEVKAQVDPTGGASQRVKPRTFHVDSTVAPNSFEELFDLSPLVVIGMIDAVLPARLTDNSNPNSAAESDVVVLVDKVIKGRDLDPQTSVKRLVISQLGGRLQGQMVVPADDALLEQGERQLLFLAPDVRTNRPNIAGLPRYVVVGIWAGKFRLEKLGGLHASHKALSGLHVMDFKKEDEIVSNLVTISSKKP